MFCVMAGNALDDRIPGDSSAARERRKRCVSLRQGESLPCLQVQRLFFTSYRLCLAAVISAASLGDTGEVGGRGGSSEAFLVSVMMNGNGKGGWPSFLNHLTMSFRSYYRPPPLSLRFRGKRNPTNQSYGRRTTHGDLVRRTAIDCTFQIYTNLTRWHDCRPRVLHVTCYMCFGF